MIYVNDKPEKPNGTIDFQHAIKVTLTGKDLDKVKNYLTEKLATPPKTKTPT
jgi:hypothetical protein